MLFNTKMIFVGYVPDINSGGNSMIPYIIKQINKIFNRNVVYFYILFCHTFQSENEMYIEMNKYCDTYLPIATADLVNDKNNIFTYPENCENPLNALNIVRFNYYFNINKPSVDNEYNVFFASPFHKLRTKLRERLSIPCDIELNSSNTFPTFINSFYNLEFLLDNCKDFGHEREGSCYTIRKGGFHPHFINNFDKHPPNAFLINYYISNPKDVIEIFNKYKYFYSYDGFTNLVQIASLCGCIPIIVPFWDFTSLSEIWDEKWFTNGIAYGDTREQIEFAINTKTILREELEKMHKFDYDTLYKELVESVYRYFTPL
jgi:hypothetical protein